MKKILIANRGEIAGRVSEACAALGITSVAVHTEEDAEALHVALADEAIRLSVDASGTPYLDASTLIDVAIEVGADAIHPGYGFLSESSDFAKQVEERGLVFIGPRPETLAMLGDKVSARRAAIAADVPVVPGSGAPVDGPAEVIVFGNTHGWPVLVKAAHGGGGRGMRVVRSESEVDASWQAAGREALAAFGDGTLFVERYIESARHVEVQIIADTHGHVVAVGDRDCSVQRRHQKLIEEAPAPALAPHVREAMATAAVRLCRAAAYRGVGTVEFLLDGEEFWFLEVNGRIQVEHPVTELVSGVDLVAEQIRIASGKELSITSTPEPRGHAIQVRVNAEDPGRGFLPMPGRITTLAVPQRVGVRFDGAYRSGDTVSPRFDSLIGKLIVWAADRDQAVRRLLRAIDGAVITGVPTTLPAAAVVLASEDFAGVDITTRWFENTVEPGLAEVVDAVTEAEAEEESEEGWVEVAGRVIRIPRAPGPRVAATGQRPRKRVGRATVSGSSAAQGEIRSPMAGTVLAVHVREGEQVESGTPLLTLESMKMENVVRASGPATVSALHVATNAIVEGGSLLVTLGTRNN